MVRSEASRTIHVADETHVALRDALSALLRVTRYTFPMQQTCKNHWCKQSFEVTPDDLKYYDKVSPVFGEKKEIVPPPTLCPECRLQRRLSFRNEWQLYRRTCDATGKEVVSMYPAGSPYIVYAQDHWWSDAFDPCAYGRDYDPDKTFFEQFHALNLAVPKGAIQNARSENCDFTNYSAQNKNCYMVVGGLGAEDCYHSYRVFFSRDCCDCYDLINCELCYECSECSQLHSSAHCRHCNDSNALHHCEECMGCHDCFGCVNLRNKSFHILNKPYSEAEYRRLVAEYREKMPASFLRDFEKLRLSVPHRNVTVINCEDSLGDQLLQCQRCHDCYALKNSRDCRHMIIGNHDQDCMDANFCDDCELQYESSNLQENYHILFGILVWYCKECTYVMNSFNSHHLFGCTGMKKHSYCILNKQYTEEAYESIASKIIAKMKKDEEWGECFPTTLSPFGYNETTAMDYVPVTKEEAEQRSWQWRDLSDEMPKVDRIIEGDQLPSSIDAVPDDVLHWAIRCAATKRPFRIIKKELELYRTMRIPVPRLHPDERRRRRLALRDPRHLWNRQCAKCQKPIATSYAPDRPEIVYCEECYLKEVY